MKFIFIAIGITSFSASYGQDKIILLRGDTISADIIQKSEEALSYRLHGESMTNTVKSSNVHKIILSNGRTEVVNKKRTYHKVTNEDDWESVEITFNESDVAGLTRVGEVVGKSSWGGVASEKGGRLAIEKMKRQAADKGCPIILITGGWDQEKDKPVSGYGRGVKIKGFIYK